MFKQIFSSFLLYVLILGKLSTSLTDDESEEKLYSNKWVVRVEGGLDEANRIAARHGFENLGQVGSLEGFFHFQHNAHPRRSRRSVEERTSRLIEEQSVQFAEQQLIKRRVKRNMHITDPLFPKQWFLKNTHKVYHDYDHNVLPVWKRGITGKGVVVSILDDGIEYTHKDLAANYDRLASYDYNSNDADPMPRSTWNDENRHGTRCAGEVAAVANNSICGVGAAPGAKVGGVRMLDGDVTDAVEASSLSLRPQHIHIYSSSWGPDDDGRTVDGPAKLAKKAFTDGILHGRGGLGSIYVWASGNGGRNQDSCNCDGYTNSIYTLSISSASEHGTSPWYSEYCSSTLATTYSSGDYRQRKIVTTDLHGKCTESHTGTSASAPLAAGILALVLEINPRLTWRDMQHIVVRTSKTERLTSDDFVTNGVGRKVSHKFGYGLLDAAALVDLAARWKTVPAQHICSEIPDATQRSIPTTGKLKVQMNTKACEGSANFVRYLEHVQAVISLKYSKRGDLTIYLTSPKGTKATLLARRPSDRSSKGFNNWPFMSTHTWEEDPRGTWTLEIENKGNSRNIGVVQHWSLVFYGTSQAPFEDVNVKEAIPACNLQCDGGCTGPSAAECKNCKHFRKETTKECVSSCSSNEFAVASEKLCKLCSTACATCSGSTNSDCLSCHPPLVLQQGKCANLCTEGWFKEMVGSLAVCKKCDENCLSCVSNAKQCTSCKQSRNLVNNRCECGIGEYRVGDLCRPCHPSCLSCSGEGESACTKCGTKISGSNKDSSANVSLFLHASECMSTCPHGFYGDTADNICKDCDKGCSTCVGPADNQCLVCSHGLNRVGSPTGSCVSKCPQGQYSDPSLAVCLPCNSSCLSCDHTDPNKCTGCGEGRFLSDGKCLTSNECPEGTYPNVTLKECDNCYESCSRCTGKTRQRCSACLDGFHLFKSECLLTCPNGTFPAKSRKCMRCHGDCRTCYGPEQSQCLSCEASKSLFQSRCVTRCPGGTFRDQKLKHCVTCDITCAKCSGPTPKQCTACKDSWILNGSKCLQPCTKGGQYMGKDGCRDCHSSCVTCTGPSKQNCTSCKGVKFLDAVTHLCSYECPKDYYGDEHSGICKPCSPGCKECYGPGECNDCKATLVLVSAICQTHCPSGSFRTATNTCEPCNSSCQECTSSPTRCIKCKDHEVLLGQSCVGVCPKGTFLEVSTKKCLKCDDSCGECSGPRSSDCTKCKSTSVKVGSRCLKECPAQYYYNSANEQCQPCDYYCHTCKGGNGRVNCTKCVEPFVLFNRYCVRVCPKEKWFHDRNQQKCIACHSSCRRCIGPTERDCISCNDPASALTGFTCRAKCPDEMFHNLKTGLCEKCHPTCKSCTGSGKHKCRDCVKGLVFDAKSGECKSICPAEQFSESGKCFSCNVSCKSCNGPSDRNCLSCKESHFLYKQRCLKQCPEKFYGDALKNRCFSCHPVCRTCKGSASYNCITCNAPLYLQNTSCVLSCLPNNFIDQASRVCKPCGEDCPNASSRPHDRSIHDAGMDDFDFFLRDPHQTGITLFLVLSIVASVVLFLVVFGILQMRSSRKYEKYQAVANGDSNGNLKEDRKELLADDPDDDDFDSTMLLNEA